MARCRAAEGRRVSAADLVMAAKLKRVTRYGDSSGNVARLRYGTTEEALIPPPPPRGESYLSAMASIYGAGARMLKPGGYPVLVTKNCAGRERCGTSLATRPPFARDSVSSINSTSSRCSRPSVMTGCSRGPPISR
jgi:hypothetical protein